MRMLEAAGAQILPQEGQEALTPFDLSIGDVNQAPMAIPEGSPSANIFDQAAHLGHSALSYVRDRVASRGRLISRGLAVGLVSMGTTDVLATSQAAAANAHPIRPMSPSQMIFAINQYEASALNGGELMNLRHITLASHTLEKTGVCQKNNPVDPNMLLVSYTLKGIKEIGCEEHTDGSRVSFFQPRKRIISPPAAKSMELTPVLDDIGSRAATSVGVTSNQVGNPNKVLITNQPSRRTIEADVFYNNSVSGGVGKKLKELKLKVVKGKERVQKLWYK